MGFAQDLNNGEQIESEILTIIQKKFPHAYKEDEQLNRDYYDLIIPKKDTQIEIRMEIKADLYKSQNLAFECLGRGGKNTGVIKTSAQLWVHYRNERYLIWETRKLKKYLLNIGGYLKDVGDDKATSAWIVPEVKILAECPPEAIIAKGSVDFNKFLVKKFNII